MSTERRYIALEWVTASLAALMYAFCAWLAIYFAIMVVGEPLPACPVPHYQLSVIRVWLYPGMGVCTLYTCAHHLHDLVTRLRRHAVA